MNFLHIDFFEKGEALESAVKEKTLRRVHQAPIEHPILQWIRTQIAAVEEVQGIQYYLFSKEDIEQFHEICNRAHAEKVESPSRPWKFLPVPDEDDYPYSIAAYEKEYGTVYYEAVYKYITVTNVVLNIFDFSRFQLVVYVK